MSETEYTAVVAAATACPEPEPAWLEACAAADAAIAVAAARPPTPPSRSVDHRELIQMQPGEMHEYATRAERAVADIIYTQGRTRMVRLGEAREIQQPAAQKETEKEGRVIQRDPAQPVILPASEEWLRRKLSKRILCQKWDARAVNWRTVDVPLDLMRHIARQGDWPVWPELAGIAISPFLRADMTICDQPGYDAKSQVYLAPREEFPPVADRPSKDHARCALETLLKPFDEFPFQTSAARSALAAHILTAVARHALDVRPIFIYTAPAAGTGKTLLARCVSLIADGALPPARLWPGDEAELKKSLLAVLLAGDSTLLIDNVTSGSKVRSAALCGFTTTEVYADRVLGATAQASAANRCIIVMTGNNITPTGDLARRSLVVRQDAGMEKVRGRVFKLVDLKGHVRAHRAELLAAALTVLRAYSVADDKVEATPLPTFETWSRVCRDPLLWLGLSDPIETQADETDDDSAGLAQAFSAIHERMGDAQWTAAELEAAATENMMGSAPARAIRLSDGLQAGGLADTRKARYWLREQRDRVAGGFKLIQAGQHARASKWQVRAM